MPDKKPSPPAPRAARKPGEVLAMAATTLVAALAFNAPAMLRSAEKLPFDAPERAPALRALAPVAKVSGRIRLDRIRSAAESAELRWLEPPPPAFPEPPAPELEDSGLDDEDLDAFLLDF